MRRDAITKDRVGLDALTLSRKRRVSPGRVARGLLPFAAGNDNETAVHRIKRLSLSLSRLNAVLVALPRQVYSEKLDRVLLRSALSPLLRCSSTSFRAVSEDKGILFLRLLLLVHGPVPLSRG